MDRKSLTLLGCGLALVLFFALNIAANATLRSWRLDMTEDDLFTLDEGSRSVVANIEEPIHLYFYFSRKQAREFPQLTEYADRILGILREYERAADGGIVLTRIDPEPFSVEEDKAVEQGVQGVAPNPGDDLLYFGLVGTSATDEREVIPFFSLDPAKQQTLEYDLSKLIWGLAHPNKTHLGILSALPLEGGGMPMMGQQSPRWPILDQLDDFFEVEVLSTGIEELPADLDVLMVVHPRGFSDGLLYLIDQWALAGKPLVTFVDPMCEFDQGDADPSNPMARMSANRTSSLNTLFRAWGFEMTDNKVACDRVLGIRQPAQVRGQRGQVEVPFVHLLRVGAENMNTEDPITRFLQNVIMVTAGSLHPLPGASTTFTPLMQTSEESQEIDSARLQFMPEPTELLASFVPGYQKLTLAARVTGNVSSAFPGGKPGAETPPAPEEGEDAAPVGPVQGLTASSAPLDLVVVADADVLNDRLWMREINLLGQSMVAMTSENVDLAKNAVESVAGGTQLLSIRSRTRSSRPFERVQEIQRDADQQYLAQQQELERSLKDAEQRLRELESQRAEGSDDLVTAEQRKEREKVRGEIVQTRQNLRDVQHRLRKDIERLGTSLKWLNILGMPLLVCALAIGLGTWRAQRRGKS